MAIKVLDGDGHGKAADVIQGIAWAHSDAERRGVLGRAVINLSVGGNLTQSRDAQMDAVRQVARRGMFVVTAAGNARKDARLETPGAEPSACNVGAHDQQGYRADFSNFGPGVDIWAPGVRILSLASPDAPKGRRHQVVSSGTSSAAPHVAGLAAYLMNLHAPTFNPARPNPVNWCAVIRWLGKGAPKPGVMEPLLYNGAEGPAGGFPR